MDGVNNGWMVGRREEGGERGGGREGEIDG